MGSLPEECSSLSDKVVTLVFLVCVRLVRVAFVFFNEHLVIRMDHTRVLSISVGAGRRQKFGREQTEMAGRLR